MFTFAMSTFCHYSETSSGYVGLVYHVLHRVESDDLTSHFGNRHHMISYPQQKSLDDYSGVNTVVAVSVVPL